jgi:hypothetical protein
MQPITTCVVRALCVVLTVLLAACAAVPPPIISAPDAPPLPTPAAVAGAALANLRPLTGSGSARVGAWAPDGRALVIAMDDACLQAVYQAANDPAICDRLYLSGVVSTCKTYYAGLDRVAPGQPAVTPTASQEIATAALVPYTSDELGLALAIPAGWRISQADFGPPAITLRGPSHGAGPEPLEATLTITVLPAPADASLDAWVEAELARYPGLEPEARRSEIMLDGEPMAVLDGLPGRFSNRQAFVQHGDRLYTIVVLPYDDPALVDLQAEAEAIWRAVTATWRFLD